MVQEQQPRNKIGITAEVVLDETMEQVNELGQKVKHALLALYREKQPPTQNIFHANGVEDGFIFEREDSGHTHRRDFYITNDGIFSVRVSWNTGQEDPKREVNPIDCIKFAPIIIEKINKASK